MKGFYLALSALILVQQTLPQAQAQSEGDRQSRAQAAADEPAKIPPPPLFPKHRRGLYRSGRGPAILDATPQSPPLELDDPGVPEKGEYEINFTTQADLSRPVDTADLFLVDANYGMSYSVLGRELPMQLKLECPIAGAKVAGQPFTAGVGAFEVGVKVNFYRDEHRGVFISVYPQLEFASADAVEKGLADARRTLVLPVLVQKELSEVTLVINATLRQPVDDADHPATGSVGIGAGRALTRHLVLMAEVRLESALDFNRDRLVTFNAGVMRSLGEKLVVYGKAGRGTWSDDGVGHTFVGVGLKVLTDSNRK